ncbi:MAG TPA: hypothetical protein PLE45_05190 [Spirochaetota bacterium]|mgnify:CR=1 FL=1|nr:hypothetical protein [Spirochaetota bacterium]HOL56734.1 hypothetical protein [Spirochaetota bacterium]HPP04173.1 hypothetical protein [Spirochaetota bacterium]
MNLSIFEIIMLICFGVAWPVSIYKSLKSKSTKGKSIIFLIIIFIGYISGVIHKILYNMNIVIIFYIINLIMVGIDIIIFFLNYYYEKRGKI